MESPSATATRPRFSISRYTVTSAEQGDAPRTLRELNALRALGAILNKRNWITKWTTQPPVRAKWLLEIEDALVKATVAHLWSEWPNRTDLRTGFDGTRRLLSAANMADEQEKRQEIERILEHVMYPAGQYEYDAFREGTNYDGNPDDDVVLEEDDEEDEDAEKEQEQENEKEEHVKKSGGTANGDGSGHDEDDDDNEDEDEEEEEEESDDYEDDYEVATYEASAIDRKFPKVFRDHQKKNPFGQIAWYVAMSIVRESLRELGTTYWTAQRIGERTRRIWAVGNQTVILRASELISNVLRDDIPVTMKLLHLTKIRVQVKSTTQDISTVLDLVVKNVGARNDESGDVQPTYSPGPAPKTWLSDGCIPEELKTKFVSEIAVLENVPEHKKDWHPNSNDQVLNLVHPSLYCGVAAGHKNHHTPFGSGSAFGFGFGGGHVLRGGNSASTGGTPVALRRAAAVYEHTKMLAASEANNLYASPAAHMRAIMFAPTPRPLVRMGYTYSNSFQWLPTVGVASAGFGSFGAPPRQSPPVYEHTKLLAASEADNFYASPAAHMRAIMFAPTPRTLERHDYGHSFQWLPSEIDVEEDTGRARIRTYINNLHPEDHASLYDSIAAVFTRFVPLFGQVLSSLDAALQHETPVKPTLRKVLGAEPRASLCDLTPPTLFEYDSPRFTLKGKRCQVIVKIAEIVLTPQNPTYDGGSWHVEGTDAERIMATGLYYFGCENITESRLSFRTIVQTPDYEQSDDIGVALAYGLKNEEALVQPLGSVTAMEDRCVVFPNILQHKVEPFHLQDPTKPGVRKILAFFLVDPTSEPVPSTAVVPPQQQDWVDRAQEPTLKRLRVPDSVTDQIQDMVRERMSLEQAQAFRLELMKERSPLENQFSEDVMFSLCEH